MRWFLILLLLPLAGCLGGDDAREVTGVPVTVVDAPSEKLYDVLTVEETWVTSSDGKRMHNAVYRPDTADPVPVFINFSPYWGNTAETGGDNFGKYLIEEYVSRGYAVVLSAIRGTGHSEGCFQIAGDREVEDLYDVIDYFANADWSNGHIAAGGKSYDSTTQNGLIAKMPHPALKGIFHVSGITDMYRYNYVNGVPYSNGLAFTPRYYATQSVDEGAQTGEQADTVAWLQRTVDDAACPEAIRHVASGTGSAVHGLKDDYWIERDWNRYIGDSTWNGSIFFYHGFQDWNVKPDHILPWIEELPEQIRVKGWLHQDRENSGHLYPMRADWNATMLAWLDTELKGHDNGFWDDAAWDLQGIDGKWREAAAWPPMDQDVAVASQAKPDGAEPGHILQVDMDPWRNETGFARFSGTFKLTFDAGTMLPDAHVTASMFMDGAWVGEAVLRGIYRAGLDAPSPIVPGSTITYVLESYPLDVVVPPGAQVTIETQNEARYSLTQAPLLSAVIPDTSSYALTLPIADASARAFQPAPTPCFAC